MRHAIILLFTLLLLFPVNEVFAHPGSGIVVDREGNVYFVDTGSGVWKVDREGTLTRLSGPALHWMAIDVDSRLEDVPLPHFSSGGATVTRVGTNPTLILSSDFPLAVGPDGSLYYPGFESGRMKLFRFSPSGSTSVFATLPPARSSTGEIRWRNGVAVSPDGTIYYTEDRTVRKISSNGDVSTVIGNLEVPGCDPAEGVAPELGPYCRGLDADSAGTVYVAATGCRAVLKITPDKKVTTVLQAKSPWSPTGVALHGSDLYVLEYLHTEGSNRREWLPRVRKVFSDGRIETIATVKR